ncbi:unnamed protein product [Microthlaspi erraticum]|uniref:Uncharacterized protein n=1 Tax=Microthlaspi erraticum TaxID=1685480 RepID=A0A6D2JIW0_9BRAS|nr:unnamed protein product [Microthlaspi erraticum]
MPIDLILEILSRATAKSVARFRLASKFCASIVRRPDFTELFLTRSSARPRLLFFIERPSEWSFYSSPQPALERPGNEWRFNSSSLVVTADSQIKSPGDMDSECCRPVSGFIYFPNVHTKKRGKITVPVVYNPSTGQYTSLPQRTMRTTFRFIQSLLGYDPIDKQFKVLLYNYDKCVYHILTFGAGKISWRKMDYEPTHEPLYQGICINGILYCLARAYGMDPLRVACFDVRSEKHWFLDTQSMSESLRSPYRLIDYMGKLGVTYWNWQTSQPDGMRIIRLNLWVLKDVEKQEWSERVFLVRPVVECELFDDLSVVGATATGEIVFSMNSTTTPFYVFYFSPERDTTERVEIQGFEAFENPCNVFTFVDHVENQKFIT